MRRLLRNRLGLVGLALTLVVVLSALDAPMIRSYKPDAQHAGQELKSPSVHWWMGTDELGRDLAARVLYGTRVSLLVGLLAVGIGTVVGVTLGLAAGYLGGWVEAALTRVSEALLAFPPILLGLGIAVALGPGALRIALAAGIAAVPAFLRLVRTLVIVENQKDYVQAAHALGAPDLRIVFHHVLPNVRSPILVQMAVTMAHAVTMEAGMSFLGLGVQPPQASLGSLLNAARDFLSQAPWYSLFPGLMLAAMLIGLNFLADGIRDLLDPQYSRL